MGDHECSEREARDDVEVERGIAERSVERDESGRPGEPDARGGGQRESGGEAEPNRRAPEAAPTKGP